MKIVLRHRVTGHYYSDAGKWVRRADNALVFDDLETAREFSRTNHLEQTQPVHRLAPYVMGLLHRQDPARWQLVVPRYAPIWDFERRARFFRN